MRIFFPQNPGRIVLALVTVHVLLAFSSMRHLALTWDEPSYIGVGSQYILTHNPQIVALQLHPPLSYYLNSVLLLPLNLADARFHDPNFLRGENIALALIFNSRWSPGLLLFLARAPFVLMSALLGVLLWRWSRQLYGETGGLVTLILSLFSPIILANSRLATPDIVLALTTAAALYFFHRYLLQPSLKRLLASGALLGLALLSKFTALLLIPTFLFVFVMHVFMRSKQATRPALKRQLAGFAAVFGIAFVVVWAGYGFQFGVPFIPDWLQSQAERLVREKPFWRVAGLLAAKKIPVPAYSYVMGIYTQLAAAKGWKDNFLFGHISREGWWYFYWAAFLIKNTLPFLVCLATACLVVWKLPIEKEDERLLLYSLAPLILFFSLPTKINIGIRYLLPLIPLLTVFAGKAALVFQGKRRAILAILCAWNIGAVLWVHPHYLAYFNELVGGPSNGYKYLVDSNLDWGQELERLADYLKENDIKGAHIRYFGPRWVLKYYGLRNSNPADCTPVPGVWAVSATYLQGLYLPDAACYHWLLKLHPKKVIGYSIFVYEVSEEDLKRF